MRSIVKVVAPLLPLVLLAGACSDSDAPERIVRLGQGPSNVTVAGASLRTFESCEPLLEHVEEHALASASASYYAVGGDMLAAEESAGGSVTAGDAAAAAPAPAAAVTDAGAQRTAGVDYSTTNVQEA